MAELTTTTKCKRALGIPSGLTMHDDFLDTLVEVADTQILGYCGVAALTSSTATLEAYDVELDSQDEIVLRNFPVSAVSAVVSSGTTLNSSAYYFDQNTGAVRMISSGRYFPQGKQTVKVSYTYGFATIPSDLSHAATLIVCSHFNRSRHAGMESESAAGYRYRVESQGIPKTAEALLARYRRLIPRGSQP